MMNAKSVAAGEQRIVVPAVYRADYLSALKAISNRTSAEAELRDANAFMDSVEADGQGIRLRLPIS